MTTGDHEEQLIDAALKTLSEHFDGVQIFATRYESDGNTLNIARGHGNFFARYGHVQEWVIGQEELQRARARSSYKEENGED
jgi:hypothetical protein